MQQNDLKQALLDEAVDYFLAAEDWLNASGDPASALLAAVRLERARDRLCGLARAYGSSLPILTLEKTA